VTVNAPSGKFYYQGTLQSAELPWSIGVSYKLDGKDIVAGSLAGSSGLLEIGISVKPNPNGNPLFSDNFSLQLSMTLDARLCADVQAEGATIVSTGQNKIINFTLLPGRSGDYKASAEVSNFEMDGIQISGVPINMDIDVPDTDSITDSIKELQDAVKELNDGAKELTDGTGELKDGASKLLDGYNEMLDGMQTFESGFSDLVASNSQLSSASSQILSGLSSLRSGLADIGGPDGLGELLTGSTAIQDGINSLSGGLTAITGGFDQTDQALAQSGFESLSDANLKTIASLEQQIAALSADPQANAATIQSLTGIIGLLTANEQLQSGTRSGLNELSAGASQLAAQYGQFNTGIQALGQLFEGLQTLKDGVDELAANYSTFDSGLKSYLDGARALHDGYRDILSGYSDALDGYAELSSGISELHDGTGEFAEGTQTFHNEIQDMDDEMQKTMDDLLGEYQFDNFDPVSFISDKNSNIESVQFVMMTPEIKIPSTVAAVQPASEPQGFLERFLALFR
jgi:X-X-X-Leu-X-X-Gly heptad repeat protein